MIIIRLIAFMVTAAATVAAAEASNSSAFDVVDDFCLRAYHQSTVKNGILYIDGGLEVFQKGDDVDTRVLGYNTKLIQVDMSSSWDWKHNISITALDKEPNPSTGSVPPLQVRGALFAGQPAEPDVHLYGGTVSYANTSFPGWRPPVSFAYSLWSYDTSDTTWTQYDVSKEAPLIPAGGAYAEAPDLGLAFYLNGFVDNGTANRFGDWPDFYSFVPGLVVIDTNTHEATNLSTESLDRSPRMGGGMAYIEAFGPQGALVALGGVTKPADDGTRANMGRNVTFDEIDFFDVSSAAGDTANGTWYKQKATGDIPEPRTDFCLTAVSAKDGSSHNIYMYGGRRADKQFDDIYVLSLPSFTWKFLYSGYSPRWGHTCHLVSGHQMITVGGALYEDYLQDCDWELKGTAILDLSTLRWGSVYNATYADYEVLEDLYKVIGGDADGNATKLSPDNGWDNPRSDLFFSEGDSMVHTTNNTNTTQSTRDGESTLEMSDSDDGGLGTGGIAGVVVGSVAGAALIIALAFVWVRYKRKQAAAEPEATAEDREKKQDPTNPGEIAELFGGAAKIPQLLSDDAVPTVYEMDGNSGRRELHGRHINEVGSPMSPTKKP